MSHLPHTELVAVAWLKTIPGLPVTAVGTTLPDEQTRWPEGFIQVSVVGGVTSMDVPQRRPILQLDCWAANPRSAKPPWGRANQIAEIAYQACYDHDANLGKQVELVGDYAPAYVQSAFPMSEPMRRGSDIALYARYGFDLELVWRAA